MTFPADYVERVYAGVLGKIIGVYLGRPFEGWTYEKIMHELGEINGYVHDKRGVPLIVTDDDISGTFTFLRALADHGNDPKLTARQIGQTWLNYLIEEKTILWWGGIGNSTEHTAYLRLKNGIPAPLSGSIETNGPIVAEQIGAQIFIDGWGMVAPGDPELAADLARRAGSVSHDGEAIYGAQCLAAMEAQAFVERDINRLLDTGVSVIPGDSTIYRLINDLREWHARDNDWRTTFHRIEDIYGYKDYIGGCHMVPNHALIILGLLYGEGDFQKSLMVCNTCGWDTDCNSGNLGCLMGIRNGLAGFEGAYDWRGPVADRMYLPTMDGGRCVSDAVIETFHIVNAARGLHGIEPAQPKGGARFHFELPGSLQGFRVDPEETCSGEVRLENRLGHSRAGQRSLAVDYQCAVGPVVARVTTPTFILPEDLHMPGYSLIASPTIYSGQVIEAGIWADEGNDGPCKARFLLRYYSGSDQQEKACGPEIVLDAGAYQHMQWTVPDLEGLPIYAVGIEVLGGEGSGGSGTVFLDYLGWSGTPSTTFSRPAESVGAWRGQQMWRAAWVNAVDHWDTWAGESFRLIQNEGRGMVTTGTREWSDYRVSAEIRPALIQAGGLAARVQGLKRFYALQLTAQKTAQLVKVYEEEEKVLAEIPFAWDYWQSYELSLEVEGRSITGRAGGQTISAVDETDTALLEGAIGLVVEMGHLMTRAVRVEPVG